MPRITYLDGHYEDVDEIPDNIFTSYREISYGTPNRIVGVDPAFPDNMTIIDSSTPYSEELVEQARVVSPDFNLWHRAVELSNNEEPDDRPFRMGELPRYNYTPLEQYIDNIYNRVTSISSPPRFVDLGRQNPYTESPSFYRYSPVTWAIASGMIPSTKTKPVKEIDAQTIADYEEYIKDEGIDPYAVNS